MSDASDLPEPDLVRAERLVQDLLPIAGVSGRERAISAWVQQFLTASGCRPEWVHTDNVHQLTPIRGEVGNLVLRLPGTVSAPRLLLSAHLDTVPICHGCRPVVEGRVIRSAAEGTGLGADNRAGTAVVLNTVRELLERRLPHPPLMCVWTVQEEVGLQGARLLDPRLLADCIAGFNWDGGSASKLTIGATGGCRLKINVRGLASHAGNAPQEGVSALAVACLAVADLHRAGWHGQIVQADGSGTGNVGVIRGGSATNVVTDHVELWAEARSHDPLFRSKIVAQIEKAFQLAAGQVASSRGDRGTVHVETRIDYESFCLPTSSDVVQWGKRAIEATGVAAELALANGGLDANWLTRHGVPTVSFGCGQRHAHMTSEQLDLDEFDRACRIALKLVCRMSS
jgi:tripeptide aminopeptidase